MGTKKSIKKYIFLICIIWCSLEIVYQLYSRINHVKAGIYEWESYAIARNLKDLTLLENFVSQDTAQHFVYEVNPNQGELSGLPDSVVVAVNNLCSDLTGGIDFMGVRKNFSFVYNRLDNGIYEIRLSAGGVFKQSFNGYNFDVLITNDSIPSIDRESYEKYESGNIFFKQSNNLEYRSTPFILRYNCNSYDLLIFKLFR